MGEGQAQLILPLDWQSQLSATELGASPQYWMCLSCGSLGIYWAIAWYMLSFESWEAAGYEENCWGRKDTS